MFGKESQMPLVSREKVGVVEIKGLIADSRTVLKQLDRFHEDQAIKAIVVRINSRGARWALPRKSSGKSRKLRKRKRS